MERAQAKDGRLSVRFGKELPRLVEAAEQDDRTPSDWVRLAVKRALLQRRKSEAAQQQAAAR